MAEHAAVNPDTLQVGDALPELHKEPISRTTLALFAGASNDHNPIHIDSDFAKAAGMPDVFAHGMLSMAYLGQLLTQWVPQQQLRGFRVRFAAITLLGDVVSCRGHVSEIFEVDGEARARLDVQASNQQDEVKLKGEAIVALSAMP